MLQSSFATVASYSKTSWLKCRSMFGQASRCGVLAAALCLAIGQQRACTIIEPGTPELHNETTRMRKRKAQRPWGGRGPWGCFAEVQVLGEQLRRRRDLAWIHRLAGQAMDHSEPLGLRAASACHENGLQRFNAQPLWFAHLTHCHWVAFG